MPRHPKPESEQSIPAIVAGLTREKMRRMAKDETLTAYGRRMEKLLDRALPPEKVDEWGFLMAPFQGV